MEWNDLLLTVLCLEEDIASARHAEAAVLEKRRPLEEELAELEKGKLWKDTSRPWLTRALSFMFYDKNYEAGLLDYKLRLNSISLDEAKAKTASFEKRQRASVHEYLASHLDIDPSYAYANSLDSTLGQYERWLASYSAAIRRSSSEVSIAAEYVTRAASSYSSDPQWCLWMKSIHLGYAKESLSTYSVTGTLERIADFIPGETADRLFKDAEIAAGHTYGQATPNEEVFEAVKDYAAFCGHLAEASSALAGERKQHTDTMERRAGILLERILDGAISPSGPE